LIKIGRKSISYPDICPIREITKLGIA